MFRYIIGFFGLLINGFSGAIIGYLVGSLIDRAFNYKITAKYKKNSPQSFLHTFLVLTAAVMRADNRLLKSELHYVKNYLLQTFGSNQTQYALLELKDILSQEYDVKEYCMRFRINSSLHERLVLIQFLFGLAGADGEYSYGEIDLIDSMANWLGIDYSTYESVKAMYVGAYRYGSSSGSTSSTSTPYYSDIENAYKILGLASSATDDEVKKAYRSLAKIHHPDKVNHLGEETRKAAEEKFKKLNEAYEKIKKTRGIL